MKAFLLPIVGLFFAVQGRSAVECLLPGEGETIRLLTEKQRAFVKMSRFEREKFFDDGQPEREAEVIGYGSDPEPVRLEWRGTEGAVEVSVAKVGDAREFFRSIVSSNRIDVWNLEVGAEYRWTVREGGASASRTFRTEDLAPRMIRVPRVPNFRDIGGRTMPNGRRVRQGLVYRSSGLNDNPKTVYYSLEEILALEREGRLATMGPFGEKYSRKIRSGQKIDPRYLEYLVKVPPTERGADRLTDETRAYVLDTLGIRTDIDLRSDGELFGMTVSPLGERVRFVHEWSNYFGYACVHTTGKEATQRIFRLLMDRRNYPLVFHCIGGADRTGTVATLLHGVLGATDEDMRKDYQVTAWSRPVNDTKHLGWYETFVKSFDGFPGANLSERIVGYFHSVGFSDADLDRIREILLEPASDAVKVSSFGYDPADSTRFLQSALDSPARRIVVDRQTGPWISDPLFLTNRTNKTVYFEPGVELVARRGSFRGRTDALLSVVRCSDIVLYGQGATLRMRRDDYARSPYEPSEHRHVLRLFACSGVTVEGLTLAESGGDGLILENGWRDGRYSVCRDVAVRNVRCIRNYRQGMSVTGADGLHVERCAFSETAGTAPQSGIDFEPDFPNEMLRGIRLREVRTENNRRRGIQVFLGAMNARSEPVDIRIEDWTSVGNLNDFAYTCTRERYDDLPCGGVCSLSRCRFSKARDVSLVFKNKPATGARIELDDVDVVGWGGESASPIGTLLDVWDDPPVGGVFFSDVRARKTSEKSWEPVASLPDPGAHPLGGAAHSPPVRRRVDWSDLDVAPSDGGRLFKFTAPLVCGRTRVVFFADRRREVRFNARLERLRKSPLVLKRIHVRKCDNPKLKLPNLSVPGTNATELVFSAPEPGFYALDFDVSGGGVRFLSADVPLAADVSEHPQLLGLSGRLYCRCEKNPGTSLVFRGNAADERVGLKFTDGAGHVLLEEKSVSDWTRFDPAVDGLVCVKAGHPQKPAHLRYWFLDMAGTDGFLFLSKDSFWKSRSRDLLWCLMMQLGHNMWEESPLWGEARDEIERDRYACSSNRTDDAFWREMTELAARKGANSLLIDLGEGLSYPSHPELAVRGSWTPERMRRELARLRSLGLEPLPKLNFSTGHDAWLKDYSRMVSSPAYYRVCADLIADVCRIFDRPRFFHLGMDEERATMQQANGSRYVLERQGELWWKDFLFLAGEVERQGSKAWCWSDCGWKNREMFLKRMPRTVLQSNWHYGPIEHMVRDETRIRRAIWPECWAGALGFLELEEGRYDQFPCGSNWSDGRNFGAVVGFCKHHVPRERLRGFLMAPWQRSSGEGSRKKFREACDLLEAAKADWSDDVWDVIVCGSDETVFEEAVLARKSYQEPLVVVPKSLPPDPREANFALTTVRVDRPVGLVSQGMRREGGRVSISLPDGRTFRARRFIDRNAGGRIGK